MGNDHGGHSGLFGTQEGNGLLDQPQVEHGVIEQALQRIIHPAPHQIHHKGWHDPGQEQEGAEKVAATDLLIEDQRHRHAEHELAHNGYYGEHGGIVQCCCKLRPGDDIAEILEAHKVTSYTHHLIGKAQPDGINKGVDDEPCEDQQGRAQEYDTPEHLTPITAPEATLALDGRPDRPRYGDGVVFRDHSLPSSGILPVDLVQHIDSLCKGLVAVPLVDYQTLQQSRYRRMRVLLTPGVVKHIWVAFRIALGS